MKTYRIITLLSLTLLMGMNPPAQADNPATQACIPDAQKLCAGIKPGEGRIGRCLNEHRAELSEQCSSAIAKVTKDVVRKFIAVCQTDVANNCTGVKPGEGRILNCLRDHRSAISNDCSELITKL